VKARATTSDANETDRRDMIELAGGSQAALEKLYERYARRLAAFYWRMGSEAAESDELVQDTFIRLWRHRLTWRGEGRVSTYIFGVAKSVWLSARSARPGGVSLDDAREPELGTAGPHAAAEGRELSADIARAMNELPEVLRTVFAMGTGGGLKYREIADLLGIPVGTVKSRMSAAHEKLRMRLARHREGG
jgi:RNA polymerase sigma-70 factor (ECF subfamily)